MKLSRPTFLKGVDADLSIAVVKANSDAITERNGLSATHLYEFKGVHERTAMGDDVSVALKQSKKSARYSYSLKRDSLYHILPEYLFHPLDWYNDCDNDQDKFEEKYAAQQAKVEHALKYFSTFDREFQNLRSQFQDALNNEILPNELFVVKFMTENYSVNLGNRFIKAVYPCLNWLRQYRGHNEAVVTMLRYAFGNEVEITQRWEEISTRLSQHCHWSLDETVDDLFCGETYMDYVFVTRVKYQTETKSNPHIAQITAELSEFREFFQEWVLGVEQLLVIEFGDWEKSPQMAPQNQLEGGLHLNYNTQLIK